MGLIHLHGALFIFKIYDKLHAFLCKKVVYKEVYMKWPKLRESLYKPSLSKATFLYKKHEVCKFSLHITRKLPETAEIKKVIRKILLVKSMVS